MSKGGIRASRGMLGKAEGQMMGGYGKWNRELVAKSNSSKLAKMTHPEKMAAKKQLRLNNAINSGPKTLPDRLKEFKWRKSQGLV
jgi:hypothetical protein